MIRVILVVSAILFATLVSRASMRASACENIRGNVVFHSTGPDSFESVLTGDLEGTLLGTNFTIVKVGDDGTLHASVDHEFITARGSFTTVATVVLSPMGPNLYHTSERNVFLPGGTNDYAGATGTLLIQAFADFNVGAGAGMYHGRICTAR